MQIFYSTNIVNSRIVIDGQEHQHISRVLRKKVGDEVFVCNGQGLLVEAVIDAVSKNETILSVIKVVEKQNESSNQLVLCVAPTKNIDRFEWMIEKCIEIGVYEIQPFISFNSERRIIKMDRLRQIAISALKQSKSLFLPKINELDRFGNVIKMCEAENKYIAYVSENETHLLTELKKQRKNEKAIVFIGPEGGFLEKEVEEAVQYGYKPVSLGKNRLRTETAGVYAAACYSLIDL